MTKDKKTIDDLKKTIKELGIALDELREKHSTVKRMILYLLERIPVPSTTKEKISDQLFLIYKEVK